MNNSHFIFATIKHSNKIVVINPDHISSLFPVDEGKGTRVSLTDGLNAFVLKEDLKEIVLRIGMSEMRRT